MNNDRPAKPKPVISAVWRHDTGRLKNFWIPIAARQIARINAVPANSRGVSESGKTPRGIERGIAAHYVGPEQAQREKIDDEDCPQRRNAQQREPRTRAPRLPCCL